MAEQASYPLSGGGSKPTPPIQELVRIIAKARFEANPDMCFQGIIRQVWTEVDPCPKLKFDGTERVEEISREDAESLIVRYEWLGTVGRGIEAFYGLRLHGELVGACAFGRMGGQVGNICGPELAEQTVCLHRGCCTYFAPDLAASFLISHACRQARLDHKWRIYFAYSDAAAGERGVVYKAAGWFFLGQDLGRAKGSFHVDFISPDGKEKLSSYAINHDSQRDYKRLRKLGWDESKGRIRPFLRDIGWKPVKVFGKRKWVHFAGTRAERAELKSLCRYKPQPPPEDPERKPLGSDAGDQAYPAGSLCWEHKGGSKCG